MQCVDARNHAGCTPLHVTARLGNLTILHDLLLEPEMLAAKVCGRWRNGVPLTLSPNAPSTDPARERLWRKRLALWKASGLKARDFCEREGVTMVPLTRQKLTPQYSLGCKRPSFSNTYLKAFNRANVLLETDPIETITSTGVRTVSGVTHDVDVLILATGFKTFEKGNMPAYPVQGIDGGDLESFWTENRFQAYQGVSVPGFPNFFTILGPYGYNGSSYFNLIETQSAHIVRALRKARKDGATRVEVTAEANADYLASTLGRRKHQVFFQDSCGLANSYYFDDNGDVPFRAATTLETMWAARRYPLDAYAFTG